MNAPTQARRIFSAVFQLLTSPSLSSHTYPPPQVTEREHDRMVLELTAKHTEEILQLKTELRESMEAAHQAELQQAQVFSTYSRHYVGTFNHCRLHDLK